MADGAQLVLAKRGKGCCGRQVGQGVDQVAGSALIVLGGGCFGHGEIVGKRFNGLGNAFGGRGRYVYAVAAIVLGGCDDVPAIDATTDPGVADGRDFVDKD